MRLCAPRPGAGQPLCSLALGALGSRAGAGRMGGLHRETDPLKFLELKIVLETCPGTAGQDVRWVPLGGSGCRCWGVSTQLCPQSREESWAVGSLLFHPSTWRLACSARDQSWRLDILERGRRPICPSWPLALEGG